METITNDHAFDGYNGNTTTVNSESVLTTTFLVTHRVGVIYTKYKAADF